MILLADYSKDNPVVIEVDDVPFISMPYLIEGLRDIQNGRYAVPEYEKEYICIENIIHYLNSTGHFFLSGGL